MIRGLHWTDLQQFSVFSVTFVQINIEAEACFVEGIAELRSKTRIISCGKNYLSAKLLTLQLSGVQNLEELS